METVWRTAFSKIRGEYQIEMPAPAEVRKAILKLKFPPDGMRIKNAVKILAEEFDLSEEQKNALTPAEKNIFYYMVALAFDKLLEKGKLKQPGGRRTPYFLVNETYPAPADVKQAILELSYPSDGMTVANAAKILAEKFGLSEELKNAKNNSGDNLFRHDVVYPQFRNLLDEGKLKQPGGSHTPYFLIDEPPEFFPPIDPPTPESIEENYQKRIDELTHELLQQIREKHPGFTVELTVSLKKTS